MGWLYGKAIVNGVPQFLSVSQLETASDCLRKWHYQMVEGLKQPKSRASIRGDELHAQLEHFLKTGDRSKLGELALRGMHMVPEPIKYDEHGRPNMLVEQNMLLMPGESEPSSDTREQIDAASEWARAALARAPLTADSIPVLGRMDVVHALGTNKGTSDINEIYDPPGTIEVLDWKSTGGVDYLKRPQDLPRLIQMAGYGEWVYRVEPSADEIRLSHGYFIERGGVSRKVSLKVHREDIAPTWEHAEALARSIRHAATETNVELVDANTSACDKYGGCAHKSYCKARMRQALSSFVGETAAAKILGEQQEKDMGLLDKMRADAAAKNGVATGVTVPIGLVPPSAPDSAVMKAAETARLLAEETAGRAREQFRELLTKIVSYANMVTKSGARVGSPTFAGEAASLYAQCQGHAPNPGDGIFTDNSNTISSVDDAVKLVADFVNAVACGELIQPADPPPPVLGGLLSPETPLPVVAALVAPPVAVAAEPEKKKPGRPKKVELPAVVAEPPPAPVVATTPTPPIVAEPADTSFSLVVDAVIEGLGPTQSFQPILDAVCAELATMTGDSDIRAAGVRAMNDGKLGLQESPLGYGRADGALAALLREREIPAGRYHLDTRGNRMAEVAAAALRERCHKTGGFHIWGRR